MTQEIYWELLAWLFRSFLAVTAFAFVVAGYQALRCRPRCGNGQGRRGNPGRRGALPRRLPGRGAGEIDFSPRLPYLPGMSSRLPDESALPAMNLEELWRLFPVILSDPRPEWAEIYRREKDALESAVPGHCIRRLSHFGSTSVPGLAAKPTIDILLEVGPDSLVFEIPSLVEKCGYREMHRDQEQMRLVLVKGYTEKGFRGQAFHLHVRPWRDWDELYFRDYLAAHPEEARKYAALKRSLKEKFEFNRDAYTEGKTELITAMTRRAREEMPGRYVP